MGGTLIRWRDDAGAVSGGSLFSVLAALSRGEAASFPALRPHQREPWHAFLCQVAAMALIRADTTNLPDAEESWRALLIDLTPDWPGGEAWSLVVDDWTKPALLQPPIVTEKNKADYKARLDTPDALDMLVTAKNHDVKQERMVAGRNEDWLFALVTLQTSEGFLGAGNYGISRMNGGFASRMSMGVRPLGGPSAAFRRDVRRLIELARERDYRRGLPLLWLPRWDGTIQLGFDDLDELYVDICRRVRLVRDETGVAACVASSKVARVAAAGLNGKTGDPWAPIKADMSASVTPTGSGFGYRQMSRLLHPTETIRPPLAEPATSDDPEGLALVAAALVRGQGKTEGLHRRSVSISRKVFRVLKPPEVLDRMAQVAERRAQDAGEAGKRLRHALLTLVQGGPQQARLDDDAGTKKIAPWMGWFDGEVDRCFFDGAFWAEVGAEALAHRRTWRTRLREMAGAVFEEAAEAAPRTDMRRIRARAVARNLLDARMRSFIAEVADE